VPQDALRPIAALRVGFLLLLSGMAVPGARAQDTHEVVVREMSRPLIRGGIVFKYYCVLCHGEHGDGGSRAARLHGGANLTLKHSRSAYYEKIIRNGGEAVGASPSMPPWRDELSREQIDDVLAYLAVLGDPVRRGEVVFKTNCVLCHGVRGDGKGRAAIMYDPPPANLTRSDKSDEYKRQIITRGGEAMRRSPAMPAWGERLTSPEIADLLVYLRTILAPPAPR
jgi:cytochrome c oxidase cbb3-type subunit 3